MVAARTISEMQAVVDQAPQAQQYFSDGYTIYAELIYGGASYRSLQDKSETYRVEGGNADLRHYLARLARRSRCFSRCIEALRRAIKVFVWAYNRRQMWNHRFPKRPKHVMQFASPPT